MSDPEVTLRTEPALTYVVEHDGEVIARFARWAHAMWLLETLRSERGRKSLERMRPIDE